MLRHESRTQPTPFPQTGNMTGFFFFFGIQTYWTQICQSSALTSRPITDQAQLSLGVSIGPQNSLAKTFFSFSVALLWYLLFDPTTWHSQSVRYVPLFYAPKPPPVVEYTQMSIFLLTTDKTVQQQKRHTRHFLCRPVKTHDLVWPASRCPYTIGTILFISAWWCWWAVLSNAIH